MTMSRRNFLVRGSQVSLAAALAPLWSRSSGLRALGQGVTSDYKAVVVISLTGGNDGNNMLVPMDRERYTAYSAIRGPLAIPAGSLQPLGGTGAAAYGLHPALVAVNTLYHQKRALVVANVGPLAQPATKQQLLANPGLLPSALLSHVAGVKQWESAQTAESPTSGWGGRIADVLDTKSGSLPLVLNTGLNSTFTVGRRVQAVAVQSGGAFAAIPPELNSTILRISQNSTASSNLLVSEVAKLRSAAMQSQVVLDRAAQYGTVKAPFPTSPFGKSMQKIAQLIAGRSVVGASRQIFYAQQGAYDTHQNQLEGQWTSLRDLDDGLGSLFAALDEMCMSDKVMICTHTDFCRTMQANTTGGSDHAWGNHQLVLGGGIAGGRVVGSLPELDLGGPSDLNGQGIWIPTQSVTQMTAGIGQWFGLSASQVGDVFPDLANFPSGAIQLT